MREDLFVQAGIVCPRCRRPEGERLEALLACSDSRCGAAYLVVGDAPDPPFPAGSFDLVGALNLPDNVGVPLMLLGQMDALLRDGGTLLLGTPYEWRAEIDAPQGGKRCLRKDE